MKKLLLFAALVLGAVSCMKDNSFDANVGGEADVVLSVALPSDVTRTNLADSATGALGNIDLTDDYDIRYILEVYDARENLAKRIVKTENVEPSTTFDLRLIPGRAYTFVVWADFVAQGTEGDNHYITSGEFGLRNVSLNNTSEHKAMDESRDAYTGIKTVSDFNSSSVIAFELKRPFAKLRVVTNDMNQIYSSLVSGKVEYNVQDVYTAFNALAEAPVAASAGSINVKSFPYDETTNYADNRENEKTLFADYLFGTASKTVQFALTVTDSVEDLPTVYFNTAIPVQRNYLTTIYGPILTDYNNVTVTINPAFENEGNFEESPYYQAAVTNGVELLKALMAGNEIIVLNDITVTAADLAEATRAGAAINPVLNLNGFTVTFVNDTNEPFITIAAGSELTITDDSKDGTGAIVVQGTGVAIENNGTINIEGGELNDGAIVNNGKANISGGELNEGAIENKGTTNVTDGKINENAITNTANGTTSITGGEFTYTPDADEVTEGFEVKTDENGNYVVVESDPVAKIGEVEYTTLKAAFEAVENGQTIVLTADVVTRSTAVLAEGKTAILDLNGKTLSAADMNVIKNNGGNLTIKNGTVTRTGDVVGYSVNNASGEITIENATIARGLYTSGSKMTANNANISHNQSSRHAIYASNCEVAINGGTYHNDNAGNATLMASGSSVVTINGGTFSIADGRTTLGWTSCLLDSQNSAEVVVNDGTYNGGFRVQAGTSMTINGGSFNDCYGSNYNIYGTVTVKGGTYTDAAAITFAEKYVADGYVLDGNTVVLDVKVAKVGNTEYRKIDDAIAAWTHNSTLTLLSDVTLTDVITIKSTEYRVLDLGTFTMTAAKGKDAISITAEGRSSASYALDIKADATNPGGITATSKAVVKTTGKSGVKDRPIIRFYNGVYSASNVISHSGSTGTNCPQFQFHNGVYNANITANRALIQIYGGTFNGRFYTSVDSSAYMLISGGKFKYLDNLYGSALNADKFTIGSTKGAFDRGVYVDDEGYIVVGGAVITEFGDKFAAKATNASKAGSYLQYSSAAANGLYYTNAEMAIKKHGEANVVLK